MVRSRWTPVLFGIASLLFFIAGLVPRIEGRPMNTTMVVLGVVFLILAAGHFQRLKKPRARQTTDPRLPASRKPDPTTRR